MAQGRHIEALYLHVPFCVHRCLYCGFYSQATRRDSDVIARYIQAMARLIDQVARSGLLAGVKTAYIGGGTPTLAGPALVRLARSVSRACPALQEFSVEANPDSLTCDLAGSLHDAGVTRVSLGVQSLNDAELRGLGRVHDARQATDAAQLVVRAGLDLSCDLMCGIPGQTMSSWERSLEGVLSCGACHVSCYPLSIEEGTPFDELVLAGSMGVPDADLQADMMLRARDLLQSGGLERYEVASYARPGHACRHNIAYWTGLEYLGLGCAASSMLGPDSLRALQACLPLTGSGETGESGAGLAGSAFSACARVRFTMPADVQAFLGACDAGAPMPVEAESLSARQAASEDLMLAMRMARPLSAADLESFVARGIPAPALQGALDKAAERGLVALLPDGSVMPTQQGWLLGNELFGLMWDTSCD